MFHEYHKDRFTISTNPDLLDLDVIHSFLTSSYWVPGIPKEIVAKSVKHSLCFGLYDGDKQIGYASVVTDYTRSAFLRDVFVLEEYRGQGLGEWLVGCVITCPSLAGIGRISLATDDAQKFYRKLGFNEIVNPEKWMEMVFDRPWFKPNN